MTQRLEKLREYAEEHGVPLFGALLVLALVIVGILVVWFVPHWEVQRSLDAALSKDRAKQLELEDAFRKTLAQIVLSVFGLFILFLTWRRARAGDATVRIMEQGHITDRFTKAIEQLGKLDGDHPNIEVRLGAIYALERIAIDSARDRWTIMEILTAYVRRNAPLDPDRPYTKGETPRTDILAILTVLGRRRESLREPFGERLDLSNSRLCGANLDRLNLQGVVLPGVNLQGAILPWVDLQRSYLPNANLEGSQLPNAKLKDAHLRQANLQGARLNAASLEDSDLFNANLQDTVLSWAGLQNAHLAEANLQRSDLSNANLQGVILREANLQDANLHRANLRLATAWTVEQIKSARSWETALYSRDLSQALGLPPEETIEEHTSPPS